MNALTRSLIVALAVIFSSVASAFADSPRSVADLDPGWKFVRDDVPEAQTVGFDDSKWDAIDLPHTWNNLDGQDGGNNYHRGPAWYRRHLPADAGWAGKEIYIKFDAASIKSEVYINGKLAGKHAGCFGAFCFDITKLLNSTGDNLIAVKVDNTHDANVPPLSGDFTVFGGIYRSVHLIVTNPLSISPVDYASSGVYVRQDKVDHDNANLTITTMVRNATSDPKSPVVTCELVGADGKVIKSITGNPAPVAGGDMSAVSQTMTVMQPHLWNGRKDPYLYTMRVEVLDGKTVADVVEQPVGLRFYKVDPEKGFFLNGEPYRLVGVNRHQDWLDKGWAISLANHQQDYADMMEMGCTGVRLSHYQHAQEMYDLCDHGGIVAWAEIPMVNGVNNTPEFDANASQQLHELIKQNFNHPAICFWSLSNELRTPGKKPDPKIDHEVEIMTKLNAEAHELDATRLTTEATAISPGKPQDAITDVVAFNRYHGWYGGKPDSLGADLDKIHSVYPNRAVGISEYGAGAAISQHEANVKQPGPGAKWHPEEWQTTVHEAAWAAIKPRTWVWGTFIWADHDFAADQRNEGEHSGRNDKGMVTYDRKVKKDAFYFYKANWSTEPVVYITERRFSPRPVADVPIKIYSNCEDVELSVNGKSLGKVEKNDVNVLVWDKVILQPGENKLEVSGTRDGKTYTDSCVIVFDVNATDGHPPATKPAK